MTQSRFDLLLHPTRMRIVQAFTAGGHFTAQELGARLDDVPTATLYRHINALVEGGVLVVAEERRVRGAVERVYTLPTEQMSIPAEELARAGPDDHMRYFTLFVAGLIGSFGRYLRRPRLDLQRDGVGYRQVTLHLSDEELLALVADLDARLRREMGNAPTLERTPRILTRIVMPEE